LRVHGLTGLRVIDASIMPTMVSGNINAAVLMIGEKGAELVTEARRARIEIVVRDQTREAMQVPTNQAQA
jgi:choline dehydrogenase